jgi:hypothetical protein
MNTETLNRPTTSPGEQPDGAAVVAHELGHLLVAWHFHAQVASISVVPEVVDGRTSLGRVDVDDSHLPPRERAMIALAGPLNASLWDYPVGPSSVDDLMRVAALGHHHQDQDLVGDTIKILKLHYEAEIDLWGYLENGRGEYGAEFLRDWRYQVEDAALAALVIDDADARRYQRHDGVGTLSDEQLVAFAEDVEPLLTALRVAWRRTAADDWFGRWRIEDNAAALKAAAVAAAQRPVPRKARAK